MSTPRTLDLPASVKTATIGTERGNFACLEGVPSVPLEERRAPVLLIPGWTGSKEDFLTVLAPLAETGHHAFAIDQRGQYQTPGDADGAHDIGTYDIETFAADAIAIARAIAASSDDMRPHLVGHSFGGHVARAAVIEDADAFRTLTLMCSGPAGLGPESAKMLMLMAEALPVSTLAEVHAAKRMIEQQSGRPAPPPEIEEFLRTRFCANDPASLLAITRYLVDPPDRVEELISVRMEKLVLFGEADDGWPVSAQADMAGRLHARLAIVGDAGHSPAVDQPEETTRILTGFFASAREATQIPD